MLTRIYTLPLIVIIILHEIIEQVGLDMILVKPRHPITYNNHQISSHSNVSALYTIHITCGRQGTYLRSKITNVMDRVSLYTVYRIVF